MKYAYLRFFRTTQLQLGLSPYCSIAWILSSFASTKRHPRGAALARRASTSMPIVGSEITWWEVSQPKGYYVPIIDFKRPRGTYPNHISNYCIGGVLYSVLFCTGTQHPLGKGEPSGLHQWFGGLHGDPVRSGESQHDTLNPNALFLSPKLLNCKS